MRKILRLAISLAGAACSGAAMAQTPPPATPPLVTPTFLLPYGRNARVLDYRPAVNPAGTQIVFERQLPLDARGYSTTTNLYIADIANPNPVRLVKGFSQTTRPDWCPQPAGSTTNGPLTFAVGDKPKGGTPGTRYSKQPGIYVMSQPQAGGEATYLAGDGTWIYPTWYPGCAKLAVDSTESLPNPGNPAVTGPSTIQVAYPSGQVGPSLSGTTLWAGFPSVNPQAPNLIALAASQFNVSKTYDENKNYVYIANDSATPPTVMPLAQKAPTNMYDGSYEGRTPTWSPDGKWIAFESNRNCPFPATDRYYAIFIQSSTGATPAVQVTDCTYDAQHAKWFSRPINDRTLLIVTVRLNPAYTGRNQLLLNARGIASLDVTRFVTTSPSASTQGAAQ